MPNLVQQAARDLNIDVPVMRTESTEDGSLRLYLYGGRTVTWTPPLFNQAPVADPADVDGAGADAAEGLVDPAPNPSPPSPNPGEGRRSPDGDVVPVSGEGSRGGKSVGAGVPTAPPTDDLTAIPGVGPTIANALNTAGYHTFADLRAATNQQLLQIPHLNTHNLTQLLDFLETLET
jgi:hypothetical protein